VTEPVVAWLVIIDGPGKGNFVKLGFGMNAIGRSVESRVSIDFGDDQISRENHALLTYDAKNRKFYIQHGGGANLTYLGDSPVLQPFELKGNEVISIGNTKLYFVPFCGANFNWD
jgi:pSer/pThr/pTyr-binding forkhead associated (FHA) protein